MGSRRTLQITVPSSAHRRELAGSHDLGVVLLSAVGIQGVTSGGWSKCKESDAEPSPEEVMGPPSAWFPCCPVGCWLEVSGAGCFSPLYPCLFLCPHDDSCSLQAVLVIRMTHKHEPHPVTSPLKTLKCEHRATKRSSNSLLSLSLQKK